MIENNFIQPLVSVIIPAYNAERFIAQTLDSVLCQTYRNIEVWVVNDGSQDKTAEIVESISHHDHRVFLLHQSQSGVAAARNAAIRQARGQLIAPIDADDVWHPQNLEKQVFCMLKAGPSVGLVYAWSAVIDEKGLLTGDFRASPIEGEVYETLLSHNFLGNASACLIRRNCFEEVGYYNPQFYKRNAQGCEDWDLYFRIAETHQFRVVPEFLIGYRQIKGSMSCNHSVMAMSHSLMLDGIRLKHSNISPNIYRLSLVNFYLYLAHESSRINRRWISLYWLKQAFRASFMTALLSYRLYSLFVKNFLGILSQALARHNRSKLHFNLAYSQKYGYNDRLLTISDIYKKRIVVIFNLLMQKIFHRLICAFFAKSTRKS